MDLASARCWLKAFDFETLFIEALGWDHAPSTPVQVTVNGENFSLRPVAEKRDVIALWLPGGDALPTYALRRKIEQQVAAIYREHIIIYTDAHQTRQLWQWVRREPGKPLACREHIYTPQQAGEALLQKLQSIAFSLEEEESLTLVDVTGRLRAAFNVERATKQFYDRFKKERDAFAKFLAGIPDDAMESWYVSVMLDRLMFIYFIQRKGFLGADLDYLRRRLEASQAQGADRFYRDFLCPLFFQGFAVPAAQRPPEVRALLGEVPYLNGGIFQPHEVEQQYGAAIAIPDVAFERVFNFFDEYQWHLDDRPLRDDREINPDVLGYIFEKYINQKQMGAYYTQEDITGYISENTILPFLFDRVQGQCPDAFTDENTPWALLTANPDRYIYAAVRQGCDLPLPPEIAAGIGDVSRRAAWNAPTPAEYALPTEIWRETIARRQRYAEVRAKLAAGAVTAINDLITYNLDLRQFAQDVLETTENPTLLWAFWRALHSVSVLDPTCGSGAFLFAALNILEPLYGACLERMAAFVQEWEAAGRARRGHHKDFAEVLARVAGHPNSTYFILKSIVVNNLYGVDIMAEAVEIAKLRLFLKLISQIERAADIEPLPDIDFNIRAGNTLVGFATYAEVERAVYQQGAQLKMLLDDNPMVAIEEKAQDVDRLYRRFREQQTALGGEVTPADKAELRRRLRALNDELDRYLAKEYGVDPERAAEFTAWRASHQPFHWFVEFYGIMQRGGFDVIIGNPPYVVYSPLKIGYHVAALSYSTLNTKNLYAFVFERSTILASRSAPVGLIVQLTVLSSGKLDSLQDLLWNRGKFYAMPFPRRPESVFEGVEMPVAIVLSVPNRESEFLTTRVQRFYTEERPDAITKAQFIPHRFRIDGYRIAKVGTPLEVKILESLFKHPLQLELITAKASNWLLYYQEACRYWAKSALGLPFFRRNGEQMCPPHGRTICFVDHKAAAFAICLLNSSLFYWLYSVFSDCEHINDNFVRRLPLPNNWRDSEWDQLSDSLLQSISTNASRKTITTKQGHTIEYDEVSIGTSKPIIDEIDRVLAQHYGFTAEELDFILNYDIKYRMGEALFENEDEGKDEG